jgi:salicylate hydroxylase
MTTRRKILIAGGGIGGLTAAGLLLQSGHEVEVFEQAPELGEVGAGIQVSANATRVLRHLGILEVLESISIRPLRTEFRLHDTAEVVSEIPLGDNHEDRFGAPYLHVYRPDILRVLEERVRALSPSAIHLDKALERYEVDDQGVTLYFADGTTARGDVLVESDVGHIDARVEMRWAQALASLGVAEPPADDSSGAAATEQVVE